MRWYYIANIGKLFWQKKKTVAPSLVLSATSQTNRGQKLSKEFEVFFGKKLPGKIKQIEQIVI